MTTAQSGHVSRAFFVGQLARMLDELDEVETVTDEQRRLADDLAASLNRSFSTDADGFRPYSDGYAAADQRLLPESIPQVTSDNASLGGPSCDRVG